MTRLTKVEKRTCPKCKREYTEHPALSRDDNKTEICPACGTLEALDAAIKDEDELRKAIERVNEAISNVRTRLEALTLTKDQDSLGPIMLEGETTAGYYVQMMIGEQDLQWAAAKLLEYGYPIYKVLGEDYPDAMWEELGRHFGLTTATSIDL